MVTLDNIVRLVPKFNGNIAENSGNYDLAVQSIPKIKKAMEAFELSLHTRTPYDEMHLPEKADEISYSLGEVDFSIKCFSRIPRPAFKGIVEQWLNWVVGCQQFYHLFGARRDLALKNKEVYSSAERLRDDFEIPVLASRIPNPNFTITYSSRRLEDQIAERNIEVALNKYPGLLNVENAENYVMLGSILKNLESFVKEYKLAAAKDVKKDRETTISVSAEKAVQVLDSTSKGSDWGYVVRTLITLPIDDTDEGELNLLAEETMSRKEKDEVGFYNTWQRSTDDGLKLYVSLPSVYTRIKTLAGEETISSRRISIQKIDIV
jgi:tetratricopeptide (TPR) repeat protein